MYNANDISVYCLKNSDTQLPAPVYSWCMSFLDNWGVLGRNRLGMCKTVTHFFKSSLSKQKLSKTDLQAFCILKVYGLFN